MSARIIMFLWDPSVLLILFFFMVNEYKCMIYVCTYLEAIMTKSVVSLLLWWVHVWRILWYLSVQLTTATYPAPRLQFVKAIHEFDEDLLREDNRIGGRYGIVLCGVWQRCVLARLVNYGWLMILIHVTVLICHLIKNISKKLHNKKSLRTSQVRTFALSC